ncbi:YfiH family protein [Bacillus tianshenii]|uniref:Purine nucleoside phosphorylase n=1 Tax=Sutcliffiella tianshenii TaxID=1463404 RepID=A0ABS2NWL5_9BACI|nr:peptidoglycan editing factor PgeF [Bacillus tianshenii]MBM7618908.1 YfiH family protein [Bacillus tianshenii]
MGEPFVQQSEQFMSIPSWEDANSRLVVGFTTKTGGVSKGPFSSFNMGLHVHDQDAAVRENKEILAGSIQFPMSQWVGCDQVHDARIEKITETSIGKGVTSYDTAIPKTDGIYTDKEDILLTLCFADCVPLYFYSPNHSLIGLAHAGWKGTVLDIGGKMVQRWIEEGVSPNEIYAAIGPSISQHAYIVDDFVLDRVKGILPKETLTTVYQEVSVGQYSIDLKQINLELLLLSGLPRENISCSSYCTSTHDQHFFSHRRDNGKTGRMMSFIGMKGVRDNG